MPELVIVGPNPEGAVPLRAEVALGGKTLRFAFVTGGPGPYAAVSEDPANPGWLYFLPAAREGFALMGAGGAARVTVVWRRGG